jgi:hypothetical protein
MSIINLFINSLTDLISHRLLYFTLLAIISHAIIVQAQFIPSFQEANMTEKCHEALTSEIIYPRCRYGPVDGNYTRVATIKCNNTMDGAGSHFCSVKQADEALHLLETKCKQELEQNNIYVQKEYLEWYFMPMAWKIDCLRDNDQSFCIEQRISWGVIDQLTQTNRSENITQADTDNCGFCVERAALAVDKWEGWKRNSTVKDPIHQIKKVFAELKDRCTPDAPADHDTTNETDAHSHSGAEHLTSHGLFMDIIGLIVMGCLSAMLLNI